EPWVGQPGATIEAMRVHERHKPVRAHSLLSPEQHQAVRLVPAIALHHQHARPIAPIQAKEAFYGAAEDVVADYHVRRHGGVVPEHQMAPVRIRALSMSPTITGIHAGVVLKRDIAGPASRAAIPVLKGVLAVPNDIASVSDVLL